VNVIITENLPKAKLPKSNPILTVTGFIRFRARGLGFRVRVRVRFRVRVEFNLVRVSFP